MKRVLASRILDKQSQVPELKAQHCMRMCVQLQATIGDVEEATTRVRVMQGENKG